MSCHSEERRSLDEESFYPSAASTRGPGWGGRAYGASRAPRKVLSVIASEYNERGNLNKTLPSFRAPARHSVGPPLCHSEEVARPTKNLIQSHSERSKESISTLNFCEQLAVSFFSCTFLCKKVPKSFCTVKMAASVFGRSLSGHGRLTLFRTPAPGAHSLDGRNPAISTSAEQTFRLFKHSTCHSERRFVYGSTE